MSNLAGMNLALSRLHSNAKPEYVFDEDYLIETVSGLVTIRTLIDFWNEEHKICQNEVQQEANKPQKTTKKTKKTSTDVKTVQNLEPQKPGKNSEKASKKSTKSTQ